MEEDRPAPARFRGVVWNRASSKWRARIRMRGRYTDLGLFDSAEAAARRYDDYAKFYLKKTAKLNFPEAT